MQNSTTQKDVEIGFDEVDNLKMSPKDRAHTQVMDKGRAYQASEVTGSFKFSEDLGEPLGLRTVDVEANRRITFGDKAEEFKH